MIQFFSDVLEAYIERQGMSVGRLATLSDIPKQTIQSWREGRVKRPRHVEPILEVAKALHLNKEDSDNLLTAARHLTVAELRKKAQQADDEDLLTLLSFWEVKQTAATPIVPIVTTQPKEKAPFQAFSRIQDFVGRAAELSAISTDLKTNGTICILQGMGGVGKSTLANHLAYHLQDHFIDGVLWGTLSAGVEREQRIMSLLRDFANAYSVDVTDSVTLESRSRIVRQLLSSKKALIILDSAFGTEDVRHILPPSTATCSILITTRNRKMLSDKARIYSIDSFSRTDSLEMLSNIIGIQRIVDERPSAIKIINFVGGLPLALRVIGSAIAEAQMVTLAEYCTLLQSERSRLEHLIDWEDVSHNVRASFELSYGRLNPNQQEMFGQLSLFAGQNFRSEAIAALTQRPIPLVKINLGRFRSLSLLEFGNVKKGEIKQQSRSEYHFHPLLYAFAREKLGQPDPILQKRLVVYYAEFVEQADLSAYTEIDSEWENIQTAVSWAHEHGWDALFHRLLTGLTQPTLGVMGFLDARGYWREGIAWFDQLLQTSIGQNNDLSTAFCHLKRGVFASYLSDLQMAQDALLQSHATIDAPQNEQEAICFGYTCEQLSRITTSEGAKAMLAWSEKGVKQLERFDTAAINHLRGYILIRQAGLWAKLGDMESGYVAVQNGIALLPDHPTAARTSAYTNLGVLATYRGNYAEAQTYWLSAMADAEEMGDTRRIVTLSQNLGSSSWHQGKLDDAFNYYNNVIEHAGRISAIRMKCMALSSSAEMLTLIGRREEAAERLLSVITLAQEWDVYVEEARACLRYITHLLDIGVDAVQDKLTECEQLINRYNLVELHGRLLMVKAKIALANQQWDEAHTFIDQAIQRQMSTSQEGKPLQLKGEILVATNQIDSAIQTYAESVKALQKSDNIQGIIVQLEIAKLRYAQDNTIDIRPDLQHLLAEFQRIGVPPKIDEVQQLLNTLS